MIGSGAGNSRCQCRVEMLAETRTVEDRRRGVLGDYPEVRLADRAVIGWHSWQAARDYGCRYKESSRAGSSTRTNC